MGTPPLRALLALVLSALVFAPQRTAGGTPIWDHLVALDFEAALRATEPAPDDESGRLARALARLNRQPRTDGNLTTAREQLAALATGAKDPDVRAVAAYNRVRADDAFVREPDYVTLERAYLAVAADHPAHIYGELALAKALTLALTHNRGNADVLAIATSWHPRVAALHHAAVRRMALVTLATALIEHDRELGTAAEWLAAARYEEFLRWDFRWRTQLRDVYVALATEDQARALALAESFAARFPHSPRVDLLRGLTAGKIPPP